MKKPKKNHVWVIEMLDIDYPDQGWGACAACGLDREQARLIQRELKERNPYDKFRIRKYISQD